MREAVVAMPSRRRIWIPSVTVPRMVEQTLHVLLWQQRGTAELLIDGRAQRLEAGTAQWVPVRTPHEFVVAENSVTAPVFFDAAETATTLREPVLLAVDRDLRSLLLAYLVSWGTIVRPEANLARQVLGLLEERTDRPGAVIVPSSPAAREVAQTLLLNPGDLRSLEQLAASVHCSTRSLERAFASETGLSPRDWRIAVRMETAARLLRAGASVQAVAHRVGYVNVNAFRRVFTTRMGESPSAFAGRFAVQ